MAVAEAEEGGSGRAVEETAAMLVDDVDALAADGPRQPLPCAVLIEPAVPDVVHDCSPSANGEG